MKLFATLTLVLFIAACSSAPSLTGPSTAASGSARSVADNPPTGTPSTSCSSVLISNFRVTGGELVGDRWKNLVEFTPVVNVTSYLFEYQRRGDVVKTRTLTGRTSYEFYDFGPGIFAARVRPNCVGGRFTALVQWSNGESALPDFEPEPPPAPEPCEDNDGAHALNDTPTDPCVLTSA